MSPYTPPPGTMCVDCKCCVATIYADGEPLCWQCDAGEPCKAKRAAEATVTVTDKVEQAYRSAGRQNGRATLKAARLLRPRKQRTGKKASSMAVAKDNTERDLPAAAAPKVEEMVFDPAVPGNTQTEIGLHYDAVIKDLEQRCADLDEKRRELTEIIAQLRNARFLA